MLPCASCTQKLGGRDISHTDPIDELYTLYKCSTCTLRFIDKQDCGNHMTDNAHWVAVNCQVCKQPFPSTWSCNEHTAKEHPEWPLLVCDSKKCGLRFKSHILFLRHMEAANHWEHLAFECMLCKSKCFQSAGAYRQHLESAHPEWPPKKCNGCPCRFTNQDLLAKHMDKMEHLNGPVCPNATCKKTFTDQQALDNHMTDTGHKSTDAQACEAGTSKSTEVNEVNEVNEVTEVTEVSTKAVDVPPGPKKTVPCPLCERMFYTAGGVGSHLLSEGCHPELDQEALWCAILEKDILKTVILPKVEGENED